MAVPWLENLNLRGGIKKTIMDYIAEKHADLLPLYEEIYSKKDRSYFEALKKKAEEIARSIMKHLMREFRRDIPPSLITSIMKRSAEPQTAAGETGRQIRSQHIHAAGGECLRLF